MWNIKWDHPATTTKEVRRAFLSTDTMACWLVKWGGRYDITYADGTMLSTEIKCLSNLTLQGWVDLANKLKEYDKRNKTTNSSRVVIR
jgi:hypothetical protein